MSSPARPALALAALLLAPVAAQSVDKAQILLEHGLHRDAKRELIEVIFAGSSKEGHARARYLLGAIALHEGDVGAAQKRWGELLDKHPDAPEAKKVKDRLPQLAQLTGIPPRGDIGDPVARTYLRWGDYWSHGRASAPGADLTRIPRVEAAVSWYDKVIEDFPKTAAAESAAVARIETLLHWEWVDPGRKCAADRAAEFMQMAQVGFAKLEKDFPKSSHLQRLRYLIAEQLRRDAQYKEAEVWLRRVVKAAEKQGDFYRDLARRRLEQLNP